MAGNFLDEFWQSVSKDEDGNNNLLGEFGSDGKYHSTYNAIEDIVKNKIRTVDETTPEQQNFEALQQQPTSSTTPTIKKEYLIYGGIALVGLYIMGGA
ncbi:MAG: hypothetical protein C0626_02085 [Arcobacter sp.]|uniref:hypothetical protein n=1 Tax=uncultured Arcobacter sp. TaxID=165434 RepID=UPI000CAF4A10|nr:hypothetical protein [uncultured Arcobacter sp.]PLY11381.1 MAG: hypothetical protein C0626_02085 [Arcobacter sp.]